MNWSGLLFLIPLCALYYLFFAKGHGYALLHSPEQRFSSPELRFRYTSESLSRYFSSIENHQELSKVWKWKYLASTVFLLLMAAISYNFAMPDWLRIAMISAAACRAILAFAETALLLSLQKEYMTTQTLRNTRLCSLLTSIKWCVTAAWVIALFVLLLTRAWNIFA